MFRRLHHQRILRLLEAFDADRLRRADCFFAGGTAIVLQLGEYRESVDIDFLCASQTGYRQLREVVTERSLGPLLARPVRYIKRDMPVTADRDGIRTFMGTGDELIKMEIVREDRIALTGVDVPGIPVPVLSREDLYAEKLLANDDRGHAPETMSRDIIDLAMMIDGWGPLPAAALAKAEAVYGSTVRKRMHQAVERVSRPAVLRECMKQMSMDPALEPVILRALATLPR